MDICDLTIPGAALTLTPEYTLVYNQIVRPHLRFTVTRYFAERWVPTFGLHAEYMRRQSEQTPPEVVGPFGRAGKLAGRTAWCIVQLRQVVIWNNHDAIEGEQACQRSLDYLERESGLPPAKIIEILREPLCQWFIRKQSGQYRYRPDTQTTAQDVNTYVVRMDDPLVPADAHHLQQQLAAHPVTGGDPLERMQQRLDWALGLDWSQPETRAQFLAPDLRDPVPASYYTPRPLDVIDLMRRLEPDLTPSNDPTWKKLQRQCELLHRRVVNADDILGGTYYFRKQWVRRLGHGQSWAILLLRDRCYDRPGETVRETCILSGYDWLADRTGVDPKTVQRWFAHNGRNSPEAGLAFMRRLSSQRGADQQQQHQIWVATRDPLTPDDQNRYSALLDTKANPAVLDPEEADDDQGGGQIGNHAATSGEPAPEVVDKSETTPGLAIPATVQGGGQIGNHAATSGEPAPGVVDKSEHGPGQIGNHARGGGGQIGIRSRTNRKRVESLRESSQDTESPVESSSVVLSSSSSAGLAPQVGPCEEEDDDKGMGKWNWDDLFKHTRKVNPENRRKLKLLLGQIPASAYLARYLAALADMSIGNPVGLVAANLIEQAESGEGEFGAGLPYDNLAAAGRDQVTAMLHILGSLEDAPSAIVFSSTDNADIFAIKEMTNRYLDCFELGTQVRHKGKYQAAAVQCLRTRIQRGLNDLGLPDQVSARQFEAVGEPSPDALPPAAEPEFSAEAEPELDEHGKPAHYSITAQEAWANVYDILWTRENGAATSTSTTWRKLTPEKRQLAPARLVRFGAEERRFVVAVADQAAQAQWGEFKLELQLELGKLTHSPCTVEIGISEIQPDLTIQAVAGQWEGMSPATVWQTTLGQLQLELSRETFNTWLREATLVSPGPGAFVVGVKNAYAKDWLANRLQGTVQRALSDVVGRPMQVHFTVANR